MKKKVKETGIVLSEDTGDMAYHVEVRKSFWNKVRYGAAATAFTLVFIALMVGVNLIVGMAAARFDLEWDMTDEKVFTVSEQSLNFLGKLDHDVELIVLDGDENYWRSQTTADQVGVVDKGAAFSPLRYIVETMDSYDEASEHVTVHYVNQLYNPGFFKDRNNLPVTDDLGDDPVIIVYSPDTGRYRYIRKSLFEDVQYIALENRLNAGIRYTTNPDMQKIAVISGHGEDALAYFKEVMTDDGYSVDVINLPDVASIPEEYQLLVISNPTRMYSDDDIDKIDKFLSNNELEGKSMLVFADLDFCALEGDKLRPYLEEWGIKLEDQCIYDPENSQAIGLSNAGYAKPPMFKVNYSDEAASMTGILSTGNYSLRLELGKTRALTKLFEEQKNISVYSLLTTYETSFSRDQVASGDDLVSVKKQEGDLSGPFDVGLLSLRRRYDNLDSFGTSVAVFGSTSLVDDYFISNVASDSQATQEYVAQLVHFTVAQSSDVYDHIPTVSLLSDVLQIETDGQITAVWAITAAVIPALFMLVGFVIWRRRKHL
ncbi:MAG: GldG family protein [Clostridia bacterium]|nr:GldG family protein [Clostridia bacterium]MBQ4322513.1 GldG family protein [Clostridia bacterium]